MYIPQVVDFSKVVQGAKDQQAKLQAETLKKEQRKKQMKTLLIAGLAVGALYLFMKK